MKLVHPIVRTGISDICREIWHTENSFRPELMLQSSGTISPSMQPVFALRAFQLIR